MSCVSSEWWAGKSTSSPWPQAYVATFTNIIINVLRYSNANFIRMPSINNNNSLGMRHTMAAPPNPNLIRPVYMRPPKPIQFFSLPSTHLMLKIFCTIKEIRTFFLLLFSVAAYENVWTTCGTGGSDARHVYHSVCSCTIPFFFHVFNSTKVLWSRQEQQQQQEQPLTIFQMEFIRDLKWDNNNKLINVFIEEKKEKKIFTNIIYSARSQCNTNR